MLHRNVFLASVAFTGLASASPRLHPIHNANGTIEANGKVYASQYEYLTSLEFQESGGRCGSERQIIPSPVIAQTDCDFDGTVINAAYNDDRTLVIQVVFHVVMNTAGAGNVDDAHIQSQIDILNEDYQAIASSHGAPGNDAKVKFVLARFDPQGNPTTGVDRVTNNAYFGEGDSNNSPMKTALHWDTSRYLNIYTSNLDAVGLLGYATFPQEEAGGPRDGVVVAYQSVGNNLAYSPYELGATATHEVGHYLGLFHTFEGPDNSATAGCNGSGDGYHQGDLINDTPKEARANTNCTPKASGCVVGEMSPIENYMDYSYDACMVKFTNEQNNRIRCSIVNYRWVDTEPTASFTVTTALLAATFAATATDAESQPNELHYNWDFGDGMTSTEQSPTHTYAAAGMYSVKLEVVDPNSAATTVTQDVTVDAGNTGSGSNSGSNGGGGGGGDDDGGDGSSGGGCCQAPKGGSSFALCSVPVAFGLMRRRRRK